MVSTLRQFFAHQAGSGKKSTALQPIIYLVLTLLTALIASFQVDAPLWISICLFSLIVASLVLFGFSYIYFMITNPDALRSEKFNITKFAMERGLVGDDILGTLLSFEETQSLPQEPDDEGSS